jgi:ribonucleoside-triphosphate reductase (thioredoxin)
MHKSFVPQFQPILTQNFIESYSHKTVPWGFNGLGYAVYKRTYARAKSDGTTEEWWETVGRCINGAQRIGAGYTQEEAELLFDHIFNLRCCFAGRMLWQLGTSTVDRFGAHSLLNCWYYSMNNLKAFEYLFENLMLGGGVGFSVRREDIGELPRVKKDVIVVHENSTDADFIVPDSREGWVGLLSRILEAFFNGGKSFTYSTILVRPRGEPIKGFGGSASGPRILIEGMEKIVDVFQSRAGKKLRSVDVLDICNIIGSVVVAGNVRRSAEIALGDPDDVLFLRAKRWDLGNIPNHRAMSNNTIYADAYDHIMENVWDGYAGNGEPYGFFNLPLSQKCGRLGEKCDDNCQGTNPCGEISLASGECCNLAENFLTNITSQEQLWECSRLLYKTQKAVAALPFLHDETNKIVHKNMRLGQGAGGICQSRHKIEWLDACYTKLVQFDKEWSKERGWPASIKLTTVKPSGTLSLLAGATPGVHPAFAPFYIRRVRMSSTDKLVEACRTAGYFVEYAKNFDGTENRDTVVVEFLCEAGSGAQVVKDMTAIAQLELVKEIQTVWSDNAVSVTVYYRKEELPAIKTWLRENYTSSVKSVSFLLHSEHGFAQAPYEEVTEEVYRKRLARIKPLQPAALGSDEALDGLECASGSCPVR